MKRILVAGLVLISLGGQAQKQLQATTAKERFAGEDKRKQLEAASVLNNVNFRNVGPTVMSGRVVDLDANPDNPVEFYVAYASGGLWYTKNNGQSFIPVSDNLPHTFMGDVAVNWKERIVWLGTGESNAQRSSNAGTGMYKTRDNGKNWEYIGLPESHHIGKVELHPTDANIAWVAVVGHLYSPNRERGIYRTEDGGKSWQQTLYIDDKTGAIDVIVDPVNPNNVYASMWFKTRAAWNLVECGKTSGIYKSTDGGKTFKLSSTTQSGFPTGEGVGRIGLTIYPKQPNILYAVVDNNFNRPDTAKNKSAVSDTLYTIKDLTGLTKEKFAALDERKLNAFLKSRMLAMHTAADLKAKVAAGTFKPTVIEDYFGDGGDAIEAISNTPIIGAEVYRSDDAGATWKKTHKNYLDNMFFTYGYVFARIWVSPTNPDKVVTISVPLMMSEDGGKTFRDIAKSNVHVDHHAAWFDPKDDNHIINGNDGGLNITYDNGENWFKANTPAVGQFYSITTDNAKPYNIYGGLQDNGVWYGPSTYRAGFDWYANGNYPYKSIGGGDGMMVQVDTRDNNTFYTGSQFGAYFRSSLDGTKPRLSLRPSHQLGDRPLRFNWETPIWLSRHNPDVLYLGTNRFYRSLNKGENLQPLSADLTSGFVAGDVPYGTLTTIHESPLKFGLIYVGSDDGNIHVSKDGGYTFTKISTNLPQKLWVTQVTASGFKEGRVYASLSGLRYDNFQPYLFVSEDYGSTWKQFGQELPMEPVNVIKEDPKNENILYVGSDNGFYVSFDRGQAFMAWAGGLPRVPVHDIAIQDRDNEVVLGTHGRSVYVAKIDLLQKLTPATMREKLEVMDVVAPLLQPSTERRRRFNQGPSAAVEIAYFVPDKEVVTVNILSAKGTTLATFKDTAQKGINTARYDMRMNSGGAAALEKETGKKPASGSLPAGDYTAEIVLADGTKKTKSFSLKEAPRGEFQEPNAEF
ncbi:glycosyl hydrolase [Segetibacter sp. 3557_3]|uniref:WD40/YVTN/BNR-like repeat-containing protein n=1 Tax=Segetibacter sp. 3557_3 TaxID=2547429 RepID=UPI001058B37E|nr:glycosyl hydrolase [Segetibacter sp. 3557_3]TDH26595.1 glycosyl hydrolase [Segetibacter sp. 3557_3]